MSTTQASFDFDAPRRRLADVCRHKHGGNQRSEEANKRLDPWKPSARRTIAELIEARGNKGMTSAELEVALKRPKNRFSGRISELKSAGVLFVRGSRDGCDVLVHKRFAQ